MIRTGSIRNVKIFFDSWPFCSFHQCCNFIQNEYNERTSTRRSQIVEDEQEAHDYEPPTIEEQVGSGDEHEQPCV